MQSLLPSLDYGRLLGWVAPPLLGAVIGYVTNAIAIRMLFRPLRAWRVFGLRLPLTPGIIPRRRHELAESIASMVSRELLTEEAVRRQLESESFQIRLRDNIRSLLGDLLHRPLSTLRGANQELFFESTQQFLAEVLRGFFSSKSFIHGLQSIIDRLVRALGDRRVEELLEPGRAGALAVERLLPLLTSPSFRQAAVQALTDWLRERGEDERTLGELVPEQLVGWIVEVVGTLLPSLFEALFRWLDEEGTRQELNRRGKRLLREVLERLNVVQRFLLSAAQYDRTLEEKMPVIVDDAVRHLRQYAEAPQTAERLKGVLANALEAWRRRPVAELGRRVSPEALGALADGWLASLGAGEGRERLGSWVGRLAGRLRGKTVRELAGRFLRLQEAEVAQFAATRVLEYLSRRETSQTIAAEVTAFSRRFLEEHESASLAQMLHVGEALQERAGAYLADRVIHLVDERLPAFIESFDVRRLVVERIDRLDVAQVERLLLMVIARHLKWINLFGGLLGAIIGFSQLVLRLLG